MFAHARDVLPILGVIAFFQLVVLRQPLPGALQLVVGVAVLVMGLALFVRGLELALFPAGEGIGRALVSRGSVGWLFAFAFLVGFGTALAEPALIGMADRVAAAAADGGHIAATASAESGYAFGLRLAAALGVGTAFLLGVLRTVKGWPLQRVLGIVAVVASVAVGFAPGTFTAVAFDVGPVTLSTITVPLLLALGIGLASSISGRDPLMDGFGLVALAAMLPLLFVLAYAALAGCGA
jgi:hypothetical protein